MNRMLPVFRPARIPRPPFLGSGCLALLSVSLLLPSHADAPSWDTFSDTWAATDALGRSLPLAPEVGPPRESKFVALFYFLWLGQHGEAGPYDISKITAAHPDAMNDKKHPAWGPMHIPHHWGESIFGYYVSEDEAVLAKHAQMLGDAGVDVIVFDVTNQLTYPRSWRALTRVFDRVRRLGNRTPQIAFLTPFWEPEKVTRELYRELYQPGLHPDLWFRWEGRPLIMADPDRLGTVWGNDKHDHPARLEPGHTLGQQFTADASFETVSVSCPTWTTIDSAVTLTLTREGANGVVVARQRFTNVADNAWLSLTLAPPAAAGAYRLELAEPQGPIGWWSHRSDRLTNGCALVDGQPAAGDRTLRVHRVDEEAAAIRKFFTFRKPQPDYFTGPRGLGEWGWLEVHPQHPFSARPGVVEEVTVGVAQNALDGKLSVLSNPRSHGRSFHQGREPEPDGRDTTGRNFEEQWRRAMELDPAVVFVTGWNEWIAGRFDETSSFYGDGPVSFVDQFNQEFSRDIEPMRGGHGDNYYYQFIGWVRRFKGAREVPPVVSKPIQIDGRFGDWQAVQPEFRDTRGDPVQRDEPSWNRKDRYLNRTGRRDLLTAKVSRDSGSVSFYLQAAEPFALAVTNPGPRLLLNVDGNPTNGWLGYDLRVSIDGPDRARVERAVGPGHAWAGNDEVGVGAEGGELELALPLKWLGLGEENTQIDFKWEDHCLERGEAAEFTLNGDAAPNDRYRYRAVFK